jgi:hypothetical protein
MYQDVYWHKTVRACGAMFKKYIYQLLRSGKIAQPETLDLLDLGDEEFLHALQKISKKIGDTSLIEIGDLFSYGTRRIYKLVFAFSTGSQAPQPAAMRYFSRFVRDEHIPPLKESIDCAEILGRALARNVGSRRPFRLLIEVTPVRRGHDLFDVSASRMWHLRYKEYEPFPLDLARMDEFLRHHRIAYVFCHPDDEAAINEKVDLAQWNRAFQQLL